MPNTVTTNSAYVAAFDITHDGRDWKRPIDVMTRIRNALHDGIPVSIGLIDGDSTSKEFWLAGFDGVVLKNRAHTEKNRNGQIDRALDCLNTNLDNARPHTPRSDVLGALQEIGRKSRHRNNAGDIDLVSNGLANTKNLNIKRFRKSHADYATIHEATNFSLPNLAGLNVTFYYLGQISDRSYKFQQEDIDWITKFWIGTCNDAGASSCRADDEPPHHK
jgi:hypothetical protein